MEKIMMKLFIEGGPLFMGVLTLIGLVMIAWSIAVSRHVFLQYHVEEAAVRHNITYIKSIGLFALIVGIFGQLIGLYQMFVAIQQLGTVSPAILAGGLKVSSITTLYGIFIFMVSYVIWFVMDFVLARRATD